MIKFMIRYDKSPIESLGGTVTRDPLESRVEGGLTGVFRNQRKISFY
jgi:hypothetical protein